MALQFDNPITMTQNAIYNELKSGLSNLSGIGSFYPPQTIPGSSYRLSLYNFLNIGEIVVELLRCKGTLQFSQADWVAQRNELLKAVREPWKRCHSAEGNTQCGGGASNCAICQNSMFLISSQINSVALGFGTQIGTEKIDTYDDLKSQLSEAQNKIRKLEEAKISTKKTLDDTLGKLTAALDKEKKISEMHKNEQETLVKMKEKIEKAWEFLEKYEGNTTNALDVKSQLYFLLEIEFERQKRLKVPLQELEIKHLGYTNEYLRGELKRKVHDPEKFKKLENDAKKVLDARRNLLGQDKNTQTLLDLYCMILERNGHIEQAEMEYGRTWFDPSLEKNPFRDDVGEKLAALKTRSDIHKNEAATWYKLVALNRLNRKDFELAASGAINTVFALKSHGLTSETVTMLDQVWKKHSKTKKDDKINRDMILCGQELSSYYIANGMHDKGRKLLAEVFSALPTTGYDSYREDIAKTVLNFDFQQGREGGDDLKEVYAWIRKNAVTGSKGQNLLGLLEIIQNNPDEAKKVWEGVWEKAKEQQGDDLVVISIGLCYIQVHPMQETRKLVAKEVWDRAKKLKPVIKDDGKDSKEKNEDQEKMVKLVAAILASGRIYYEVYLENTVDNEQRKTILERDIKHVLEHCWTTAKDNVKRLMKDFSSPVKENIFWTGNKYSDCLMDIDQLAWAEKVLAQLQKIQKDWKADEAEMEETLKLLGRAKDKHAGKKPTVKPGQSSSDAQQPKKTPDAQTSKKDGDNKAKAPSETTTQKAPVPKHANKGSEKKFPPLLLFLVS